MKCCYIYQLQFNGREYLNLCQNSIKLKLYFNHIIKYLCIKAHNVNINSMEIFINGANILKINKLYRYKDTGYYMIPFTKGEPYNNNIKKYKLNLSRIDNFHIQLQCDNILDNAYVDIIGISLNMIKSMGGMMGLASVS